MSERRCLVVAVLFMISVTVGHVNDIGAQQIADPNFDATVAHPAYTASHPRVAIDEAHKNIHTARGLFKPFADLSRNDGYDVVTNTAKLTSDDLRGNDVLVISNALGELQNDNNNSTASLTEPACDAV